MAAVEQRYAQALADLAAQGAGDAHQLAQELRWIAAELAASAPLAAVLASPAVPWERKRAVLEAVAERSAVSRLTRNFLLVAAQRGRITRLAGIEQAFEALLLEREGVVKAEVSSARTLAAAECAAIEGALAARLGRKLQTRYVVEPGLLGGFLARVGDQVFDGSIRGRLERLRQRLVSA